MHETDAAVIAELAAMDTLAYERARWPAARRLRCHVRVLDGLVEAARRKAALAAPMPAWARPIGDPQ